MRDILKEVDSNSYVAIKQLVQLECAQSHEILVFDPINPSEAQKSADWIRVQFNDGTALAFKDRHSAAEYLTNLPSALAI